MRDEEKFIPRLDLLEGVGTVLWWKKEAKWQNESKRRFCAELLTVRFVRIFDAQEVISEEDHGEINTESHKNCLLVHTGTPITNDSKSFPSHWDAV
jgi:hypothetical protein